MENKFFIYKNRLYEFNLNSFLNHSRYFLKKQQKFADLTRIFLIDDTDSAPSLSESSINNFIQFCNDQKIEITVSNVLGLNFLSNKYEVNDLNAKTEEYISKHYKDIIHDILSNQTKNSSFSIVYENIISKHLHQIISTEEELLLLLPMSVIYRILCKYFSTNEGENVSFQEESKFKSFFTKIINKHGLETASILMDIDYIKNNTQYMESIFKAFLQHKENGSIYTKMLDFLYENITEVKSSINTKIQMQTAQIEALKKQNDEFRLILNGSVKSVNVPHGERCITKSLFCGCSELEEVNLPSSVTTIENKAFFGCNKLKEVNIPPSVSVIGEGAFGGCQNIECLQFDPHKVEFSENSFDGCDSLKCIKVCSNSNHEKQNQNDDSDNDDNNDGCKDSIFFTSKMTERMFDEEKLNKTEFSQNFENISNAEFEVKYPSPKFDDIYKRLKEIKDILSAKISIAVIYTGMRTTDKKFRCDCELSCVKFDETIQEISSEGESGSFEGCTSLCTVTLPKSLTSIGSYSFSKCSSLSSLMIPPSVKSIDRFAFSECLSLTKVDIPSSVKSIGNNAFYRCKKLREVTIGSSVRTIGWHAFSGCSSLLEVDLPRSIKTIGWYTFSECESLKEVKIPASVKSIESFAFYRCNSLLEVLIPISVTSIGQGAFSSNTKVKRIKL